MPVVFTHTHTQKERENERDKYLEIIVNAIFPEAKYLFFENGDCFPLLIVANIK